MTLPIPERAVRDGREEVQATARPGPTDSLRQHVDFLLDAVQLRQHIIKPRDDLHNGRVQRIRLNHGRERPGWRDS